MRQDLDGDHLALDHAGQLDAERVPVQVKATMAGFSPPSGPVGTVLTISGSAFTGTSKVQFGKKAALFTVGTDGQITATVPAGATTGVITITTPGGKTKSATQFVVT